MLLCSGYIAGGAIAGILLAFLELAPAVAELVSLKPYLPVQWNASNWPSLGAFAVLMFVLLLVGFEKFLRANREPPAKAAGK